MKAENRSFWGIVLAVTLAVVAIDYAPLFTGKVPFPASIALSFPPYISVTPPEAHAPQPDIGDLATAFYPFRMLLSRSVREEGRLPLWNPYMLGGTPFLANAQSALFYPPNFLYYVLPLPVAWAIGFPLRLLLAALFTALLMRRIGATTTGSLVGGLLFAFCGFLAGWQGQAMADAAIWLPLICFSVVQLHDSPSFKRVALTACAFAMPVLAGHPETAIHLTLFGTVFAVYLAFWNFRAGVSAGARFVLYFSVAGALSVGLAAVQLLPTVEWLKYVYRSFDDTWPPLPFWRILGFASRDFVHLPNAIGLHIPIDAAYLGVVAFIAAPVAWLHGSRRFVWFFGLSTAAALSVVYGFGPMYWLTSHLPFLKIVKNERMILLADFSIAVLAGLGISVIEQSANLERRRRFFAAVLAAVGAATLIGMIVIIHWWTELITEFVTFPRFSLYLLIACAIPIGWKLIGGLRDSHFAAMILVVLAVDVLTFAFGSVEFTSPRNIFPDIPLFQKLNAAKQPFRIAPTGEPIGINFQMMYGLSSSTGFDVILERLKRFTGDLSEDDMTSVQFRTPAILALRDRRMDMLNTKYFVVSEWDPDYLAFRNQPDRFRLAFAAGDTDVYENLKVLPAAFLVPDTGIEIVPAEDAQLRRIQDTAFDPEQTVLLETPAVVASNESTPVPASTLAVSWLSKRTNDFDLRVDTGRSSILVVSQIYYPGWKAYVDGQAVTVAPADLALTAIPVPAGSHAVHFEFDPFSYKAGLLLTLTASLIAIGLGFQKSS